MTKQKKWQINWFGSDRSIFTSRDDSKFKQDLARTVET
jgi:hypothetical protein